MLTIHSASSMERLKVSLEYVSVSGNPILARASEYSSHINECDVQGEILTLLLLTKLLVLQNLEFMTSLVVSYTCAIYTSGYDLYLHFLTPKEKKKCCRLNVFFFSC